MNLIVLLDIVMPVMDGVTALERIKGDPALRAVPVIMISAVEDFDSVIRCIELGAEDYLQKPFDAVLLRARTILDRLGVVVPGELLVFGPSSPRTPVSSSS